MNNHLPAGGAATSSAGRWVDPSFSDFSGESLCPPAARRTAEVKKPRKRKGDIISSVIQQDGCTQSDQGESWVDRHHPSTKAELAVHKKKIEEVENWLSGHTSKPKGGILLLTGPSGCGKTASIKVLCQEMGLRLQEWSNATSLESNHSSQGEESQCGCRLLNLNRFLTVSGLFVPEWRVEGFSASQQSQFKDFLLRANKYSCLKMLGDVGTQQAKLILVEDFPNVFYKQPGSLHDVLRSFRKSSRCPLVFVVSDSLSGDSSSRLLFPKEVLDELDISTISFNPVAPTAMIKVLTRIYTLESGRGPGKMNALDPTVLESVCSGSSGDIRNAINNLQFCSLPDSRSEKGPRQKDRGLSSVSRPGRGKKRTKPTKERLEEQAIGGKDACLFLFRALGKILHCKRGSPEEAPGQSVPPPHLPQHHRGALLLDPESVVELSHMSGEFFNLYLHQNYLDFFSDVEDVERASEYLSEADLLMADWLNRSVMTEYGSSVATRGLLHSNTQQVAIGFRPLHKPHWLLVNRKHKENSVAAQSLFRSFCLAPAALQTQLVPYLAKLTNPMRNQAQIAFIQDVGHMSLRRFPGRLKLEALTDKEPGQLMMDSEEEEDHGVDEESLPASQPQPTMNQALLEEDDLRIEEYLSD
ncbi:cell cycle checkpoint protein RAD17 isoform X1 [Synchiropus splendidus]|uniref:cell cycle checkpoint protein RAD17 isoform X1 n=1 Tax=Synchiropus splendidus TaxID=270530 RepID=UPI00237EB937|nr:cell cycle checkpoint protein RAD17 isoform X1 [Synchiropus splendidus]